ncbi:unnamed protein product [Lymnaea stagnalis]|uniref:Ubiquitin-like domain-containing protein n=1 Tax=Lymnaea stagnalis TaxID=6523 RepID=A0AAV2HH83_LYMST
MPPTNQPHQNGVHGSRDSHVPNGRPTPMEVEKENGLTITASLSESSRFARRNQPVGSSVCVTVSPRPGERPTTHTVLKQGNGELKVVENRPHASNVQAAVNRQAEILGTITIGETTDTFGGGRPVIPQQPCTFQIFVNNFADSRNYTFEVQKSYRVDKLMDMIFDKLRITKDQQHLTYAGRNLAAPMTLEHYGIKKDTTVFLTGRLRGG